MSCTSEAFEDDIEPLLVSHHTFDREHFYPLITRSPTRCSVTMIGPTLTGQAIGWTKTVENSRIVYLQPGDGPDTYASPHYRRLIENAIRWVAEPD